MRLLFLVMLAMFITPIRGRKLLLKSVLKEDRYFKELISSLKNLLTCLEDPIPHQVSLTRFYDLPRPWSVAASIHGANLPVLLEQGSRRGSINVLSAFPNSGDLSRFAKYLSLCPRTNPLGVFVIVYMHCHDLQIENVHGINREFYLKLGTSRVIHFCADSNSFVYISKSHNGAQEQWHIMMKTVSGFCNEQMDERKRMVQLNTGLQNLNGFRFDFVIREQHAWIDRRAEDRFGGRDPNFAILLTDYGMQWLDSSKRSNLNTMSSMDLELGLPVWRTTEQWVSKQKFRGSITATVTQSNEYLVVRKAQRVPFGLVLLLPYDWKTWSFLGGILVLFVLALTLQRYIRCSQCNSNTSVNAAHLYSLHGFPCEQLYPYRILSVGVLEGQRETDVAKRIQLNLHHCDVAQDFLAQTVRELKTDVAILSCYFS